MDFPQVSALPQFIHPFTIYGIGEDLRLQAGGVNPASMTWVANSAVYVPFTLPWQYPVNRVFWGNGATAGNNADFGIYTASGRQIYHTGSTVTSGTSTLQFVTPSTTFVLDPGNYFMAWACSGSTTAAYALAITTAGQGAMCGAYSQASAMALPSTATFASLGTTLGIPIMGITRTPSGF